MRKAVLFLLCFMLYFVLLSHSWSQNVARPYCWSTSLKGLSCWCSSHATSLSFLILFDMLLRYLLELSNFGWHTVKSRLVSVPVSAACSKHLQRLSLYNPPEQQCVRRVRLPCCSVIQNTCNKMMGGKNMMNMYKLGCLFLFFFRGRGRFLHIGRPLILVQTFMEHRNTDSLCSIIPNSVTKQQNKAGLFPFLLVLVNQRGFFFFFPPFQHVYCKSRLSELPLIHSECFLPPIASITLNCLCQL